MALYVLNVISVMISLLFAVSVTFHYDVKGRGCMTVSTVLILSRFSWKSVWPITNSLKIYTGYLHLCHKYDFYHTMSHLGVH